MANDVIGVVAMLPKFVFPKICKTVIKGVSSQRR